MPWADIEQHIEEWHKWVQAKCPVTGALRFRTVHTAGDPVQEPGSDASGAWRRVI